MLRDGQEPTNSHFVRTGVGLFPAPPPPAGGHSEATPRGGGARSLDAAFEWLPAGAGGAGKHQTKRHAPPNWLFMLISNRDLNWPHKGGIPFSFLTCHWRGKPGFCRPKGEGGVGNGAFRQVRRAPVQLGGTNDERISAQLRLVGRGRQFSSLNWCVFRRISPRRRNLRPGLRGGGLSAGGSERSGSVLIGVLS